jgi:hypothetical protein
MLRFSLGSTQMARKTLRRKTRRKSRRRAMRGGGENESTVNPTAPPANLPRLDPKERALHLFRKAAAEKAATEEAFRASLVQASKDATDNFEKQRRGGPRLELQFPGGRKTRGRRSN